MAAAVHINNKSQFCAAAACEMLEIINGLGGGRRCRRRRLDPRLVFDYCRRSNFHRPTSIRALGIVPA